MNVSHSFAVLHSVRVLNRIAWTVESMASDLNINLLLSSPPFPLFSPNIDIPNLPASKSSIDPRSIAFQFMPTTAHSFYTGKGEKSSDGLRIFRV